MTICEPAPVSDWSRSIDAGDLRLLDADVGACDRDGVMAVLDATRRLRAALDAAEVRAHRRLHELASVGSAEPSESAVADAANGDGRHGRQVAQRDELCLEAPSLEDALEVGDVSGAHLDAVANAAKRLPDDLRAEFLSHADDLVSRAGSVRLDVFRRECNDLARHLLAQSRRGADADELNEQRDASTVSRWVDKVTGMHHTMLALDPVRDAEVFGATARELARLRQVDGNRQRPWKQLEVDAWVNCLLGRRADAIESPGVPTRAAVDRAPQIIAVSDVANLRADAIRHGVCETSDAIDLPVATLRRLCCDAEIIPAVMDGPSRVLDLGRSKRTASSEQRHALRAMHATCVFPGCTMGFESCRVHHVDWWGRDVGPTDLENLVPLCEHDHHLVHEGGWELSLDTDRVATWTRPDGTLHRVGPIDDRIP